nr:hypothetical protein [uncultured Anaerocolumna sp.]
MEKQEEKELKNSCFVIISLFREAEIKKRSGSKYSEMLVKDSELK